LPEDIAPVIGGECRRGFNLQADLEQLEAEIKKHDNVRLPGPPARRPERPTEAELAEIKAARYPHIIAPHKCESIEEWRAVHVAAAEKRRDMV
jgi:hypothetical protein